ncbi:dicarboxylate transporter/tellurite-resistance protein TehA [Rhizobium sp. P40RR-XXII]|uniref:dicarboxylate transporter/tellurite-resistance protein TehA n=1 Tax=unclassified Rhizobium TaxID=2613769 RepID=UPI001457138F|nr:MULTISPECIES: dicarboxylate transporter/tellurite-resistance protein TehA [unclassified Rhizobium]NLR83505.1 dicarboxylate transporter/tellurite-resistance protein TehA [Rhizobium sp. P28RR-XV]NLS15925.1 dicarboxylate transporter/tellurite-resistance protein TehA [Rhizobium sp. P40RR-XXII]
MAASLKLPLIPAAFFGMVLGLSGLANAWRVGARIWQLPTVVGEALTFVSLAVWLVLIVLYALKWMVARDEALKEVAHPVQCCFIGLVGVATMLVAGGLLPYSRIGAETIFLLGAVYTLAFSVWRTGGLWQGERDIATTTAVLYLPSVAGSFVTAIVGAALGFPEWAQLFFGAGFFAWLAIESALLHRLLTGPALAPPLRPTLGIQLAPPAVGALAYISVTKGSPDMLVHAMIGYGLLQALIMLRLLPWIAKEGFSPAYWAFTFGATALATAPMRLVERGDVGPVTQLAPMLFVVANLVVALIALATIWMIANRRLAIGWVELADRDAGAVGQG